MFSGQARVSSNFYEKIGDGQGLLVLLGYMILVYSAGIFFGIDDAFRTGAYVEVEGTMGTVENISIRFMQLRHHKGPVHTIP